MLIEHAFRVDAPLDRVWETLLDVEQVAVCLPGAELMRKSGEGVDARYDGRLKVKLGPISLAYSGVVEIVEADAERRVAVMRAAGADDKGQGAAKALITSSLRAVDGHTEIRVSTELEVTGRVAQLGRSGLMQDVSDRLIADFARCLESKLRSSVAELLPQGSGRLTGAPDAEGLQQPVKPISLLLSVLLARLKRIISRGERSR